MAEAGDKIPTLSELYQDLWTTYIFTENTNDPTSSQDYQVKLRHGIQSGEKAIHMVNQLHLYSDNENIDEVATNEVRYLLLPAILGYLSTLLNVKERIEVVKKGKDYFTDFLRLCKSYEVTDVNLPPDSTATGPTGKGPPDLIAMSRQRGDKIKKFQEQKERAKKLKDLSVEVEKDHVDDEVKRDYYLTLCQQWVEKSLEELDSLNCEVTMLKFREQSIQNGHEEPPKHKKDPQKKQAFRPFIITKDMIQKQVYGAGYPSRPVMTVDEFYEERVRDGTFQAPGSSHSMQDWANDPEKDAQAKEQEDSEKEKKIEEDDEETLQKARDWDEWKDDHRRGWGNRKNMG